MKKLFLTTLLAYVTCIGFAKNVKFAVDMTGQTLSPNGIHVFGDFQSLAGFAGGDWNPASTTCFQEGATDIYSVIVDIPAFAKYEYKFVNGDQSYEAEFIPEQSRIGYNFNDNRWIYVDSLANDTTFAGAILFAGNAPMGLTLVRFIVDMQNEIVSPSGVHVAGTHQNWNTTSDILYSFGNDVYEVINYVTPGTWNYKFYNGNTVNNGENIPAPCSVFGNREIQINYDSVLAVVCFSSCVACVTGISETISNGVVSVYPNPADNDCLLRLGIPGNYQIALSDISGRVVRMYPPFSGEALNIAKADLDAGAYLIHITSESDRNTLKVIFR